MSELKCDTCNIRAGTIPCDSCPYKPQLMARLQEEIEIAKEIAKEYAKMAKASYVVTPEEEKLHNMDRTNY